MFKELENDCLPGNRVYRLLLPDESFDIRAEYANSTGRRRLAVEGYAQGARGFVPMRGLSIISESGFTVFELTDIRLSTLFSALVDDICRTLELPSRSAPCDRALERLALWRRLFSSGGDVGLSDVEQRGLFGELLCLRDLVLGSLPPAVAVRAWTGPQRQPQDFITETLAIEVKTRVRNAETKVRISSEQQLELSDRDLFLVIYALQAGEGSTLNDLVDELHATLEQEPFADSLFSDSLIRYGYLDVHRERYALRAFTWRQEGFHVRDQFPRIESGDLRPSVSRVSYEIDVASCLPYVAGPDDVKRALRGGND